MSNTNKPLTAEEIKKSWSDWNFEWKGERNPTTFDAYKAGADFAAQQTAALREELEALEKERDYKDKTVQIQVSIIDKLQAERDEAVKLLKSASDIVKKCNYPGACYSVPAILKALFDNNVNSFISR